MEEHMEQIKAYYKGLEEGVRRFAWWKDGNEYVGSCGTRLSEALKDIDMERMEGMNLRGGGKAGLDDGLTRL